jgi:DNA repair exonuclease SbcCD ATPase subunit
MIPKRIVLENFLSFGSPETEIVFTDDEPLWVLGGPNGVGKSAVFDAMTYALYGEHRGGASDHTSLIRHGANGFRVTFEFDFNGDSFQIVRNRPLKGRPTQTLMQWANGGWTKPVPLPDGSIKVWTQRTLGVTFDAFKASVLLRQGEADAIITARGTERLTILKKIIGVERYEQLSEKIHDRARGCDQQFKHLQTQRQALKPIGEDAIKAAHTEFALKEEERAKAHEAHEKAVARVPLAKEWARLDTESKTLNQKLQEADKRARDAKQIRKDHARLCDLTTTLPLLRQLLQLRADKTKAEETLAGRQTEAKRLGDATKAKQLRDESVRDQIVVDAAQAVKDLKKDLAEFDAHLAEQVKTAEKRVQTTSESFTETAKQRAAADALLEQALHKQEEFGTLEVGVKCSLCGQQVTAKHANQERERLAGDIKQLERTVRKWTAKEQGDKTTKDAAVAEWIRLDQLARKQERLTNELGEKEKTLRAHGVTAKADELRKQLADKKADIARLEKEVGDQSHANLVTLMNSLKEVEKKVKAEDKTVSLLQGQESTACAQLLRPTRSDMEWQGRQARHKCAERS